MIDVAVEHIRSHLNQFLKRTFDINEDVVVMSNILEQDGNIASLINDKLAVFLVNIEKDSTPYSKPNGGSSAADLTIARNPPLYVNLYLMFAANFNNYPEALKFISNTINFFQRRPFFDHHNSPDLDTRIEKLMLEVHNLSIDDLSNLWGVLSGRYLPSVLYKVRVVAIDAEDITAVVPTIRESESTARS